MMLMFRFSQEFPRKGNDKALTFGSPILWCMLQPASLPIPLANTMAEAFAATGNSSELCSHTHQRLPLESQTEATTLQTAPPEHPAHSSWARKCPQISQCGSPSQNLLCKEVESSDSCAKPALVSPPVWRAKGAQVPSPAQRAHAVTAVSEVALDSCRCTCAGSRGLCGRAQTAPCSPGNSATSLRCCKAEPKGRQVRHLCYSNPAPPAKPAAPSGMGEGPWLEQLW